MNRYFSQEEFIKIWQESATVKEVAEKIGSNQFVCSGRAYKIRKQGVPLQKFFNPGTGRKPIPGRVERMIEATKSILSPGTNCKKCEHLRERIHYLQNRIDCLLHQLDRRDAHIERLAMTPKPGG